MPYTVKILANLVGPAGVRLFTVEAEYPRFFHQEALTHRDWSRNAASSRAIPTAKLMDRIENDPVIPLYWGENQAGMVAESALDPESAARAQAIWLETHAVAVAQSHRLKELKVHKQLANRMAEPWMYITSVISATEWGNFFALRTAEDVMPEFQKLARMLAVAYYRSVPMEVPAGYWSLPYVTAEERANRPTPLLKKLSVARVCRVSYLNHDGSYSEEKDLALHDQLVSNGHWSPFEHIAAALPDERRCGNFVGWYQYRKEFPNERRSFVPDPAQLDQWARDYDMRDYLNTG